MASLPPSAEPIIVQNRLPTDALQGQSRDTICRLLKDWENEQLNFPHAQSPGMEQCYKSTLPLCQETVYWPRVETPNTGTREHRLRQPQFVQGWNSGRAGKLQTRPKILLQNQKDRTAGEALHPRQVSRFTPPQMNNPKRRVPPQHRALLTY